MGGEDVGVEVKFMRFGLQVVEFGFVWLHVLCSMSDQRLYRNEGSALFSAHAL